MDEDVSSELVRRASALLDRVELSDFYGPASTLDDAIATVLVALGEGPSDEWNAFLSSLTEHRRHVLGRFAIRAPMVALRSEESWYLHAGLLAHCVIRRRLSDWRDDMVFFAPYMHVAQSLDIDAPALFDKAALHASPELAPIMQTFGRRTDVTLAAFGWREVETSHGPTFETVNWGGGPSGAVVGERSWDEVNRAMAQELLDWVRKQKSERAHDPGDESG